MTRQVSQSHWFLRETSNDIVYEAFSKVIQKLIPQLPTLENMLDIFISVRTPPEYPWHHVSHFSKNCRMEKAFLIDVISKIYIATDSSPVDIQVLPEWHQATIHVARYLISCLDLWALLRHHWSSHGCIIHIRVRWGKHAILFSFLSRLKVGEEAYSSYDPQTASVIKLSNGTFCKRIAHQIAYSYQERYCIWDRSISTWLSWACCETINLKNKVPWQLFHTSFSHLLQVSLTITLKRSKRPLQKYLRFHHPNRVAEIA